MQPGDKESEDLDEKVANSRVSSNDVLKSKQPSVPGHFGFGTSIDVVDETVNIVLFWNCGFPVGKAITNYTFLNKPPDFVAPVGHSCHVTLVERHQEWHEICCVALVYFVEDLVEVLDHVGEGFMTEVESFGTEVGHEDVGTGVKDQWLGFDADS